MRDTVTLTLLLEGSKNLGCFETQKIQSSLCEIQCNIIPEKNQFLALCTQGDLWPKLSPLLPKVKIFCNISILISSFPDVHLCQICKAPLMQKHGYTFHYFLNFLDYSALPPFKCSTILNIDDICTANKAFMFLVQKTYVRLDMCLNSPFLAKINFLYFQLVSSFSSSFFGWVF